MSNKKDIGSTNNSSKKNNVFEGNKKSTVRDISIGNGAVTTTSSTGPKGPKNDKKQ